MLFCLFLEKCYAGFLQGDSNFDIPGGIPGDVGLK
jgi:hypothetical protein